MFSPKHTSWALFAIAALLILVLPTRAEGRRRYCHLRNMVSIRGNYCIDKYESRVQVRKRGRWRHHSPYESVRGKKETRAISRKGEFPQAYISRNQAEAACKGSKKRLCTEQEWVTACKGKIPTQYPYGPKHKARRCNDSGKSPLNHFHGKRSGPPLSAYGWKAMNEPRLNQLRGSLARTGQFRRCRNSFGLFDMVGNLHEWVAAKSGTFRGGYYLDTKINGEGCDYRTVAHSPDYHDYSTGFRCCAELR